EQQERNRAHVRPFGRANSDISVLASAQNINPGQVTAYETVVRGATRKTVLYLELERDDGQRVQIDARSVADVVALFNEELRARGRTRRLIALDTSGEWECSSRSSYAWPASSPPRAHSPSPTLSNPPVDGFAAVA